MTRDEALTAGLRLVDTLGAMLPRRQRGTAPDRTFAALAVAEFLLGDDDGNRPGDDPTVPIPLPTDPAEQRRIAASLLNAADRADGTVMLNFVDNGSDG